MKCATESSIKVVTPPSDVVTRDRNHLARLHAAQSKKIADFYRFQREGRAAFRDATMRLLTKRDSQPPQERKFEFGNRDSKSQQRLAARLPLHSLNTLNGDFAGWVVGEAASPGNNASSGGSFNQETGELNLDLSAGMNSQQGGSTTVWGYIGQYFQAADLPSSYSGLTINATLSAVIDPAWTITNYCTVFSENADLTAWVFVICQEFDDEWNLIQTLGSPTQQIYSNNNPDSGSYNWPGPDPESTMLWPLSFAPSVSAGSNLGVFVCLKAMGSAAGASTGALVPGSELTAQMWANLTQWSVTADVEV